MTQLYTRDSTDLKNSQQTVNARGVLNHEIPM